MTDWQLIASDVGEAINQVGFSATLMVDNVSYPCRVIRQSQVNNEQDGTQVQEGTQSFMMSADGLNVTPSVYDEIHVNGDVLSVTKVHSISPAGVILYYIIKAAR